MPLLSSNSGYSYIGEFGIHDTTYNFVENEIRPGDILQLLSGPSQGDYTIISVQPDFVGVENVRMFTKEDLSYRNSKTNHL